MSELIVNVNPVMSEQNAEIISTVLSRMDYNMESVLNDDDVCQSGESNNSSLVSLSLPERCFTFYYEPDLSNYGCGCIVFQSATGTIFGTCMDA